ncbi:MAG: hypothetical protein M3Q19_11955 [Pseudomonadota bacterium]|nr:hypothetical protein [Pseudomonadota bacterium]
MSQSIRFLGFAVLAWAAVRAISLGIIPGTQALAFDAEASQPDRPLPPIQPTMLPPLEPVRPNLPPQLAIGHGQPGAPAAYGAYPVYAPYPVYLPAQAVAGRSAPPQIIYVNPAPSDPREMHVYGTDFDRQGNDQRLAMVAPVPQRQSTPSFDQPALRPGLDRLSLTGWATMRNKGGPDSLAGGGTLGGSEAGSRLMWRFTPKLAATLRASAPINSQRGAEAALGLRYQPFDRWPVAVTLERRHGFRDYGQSAFALFAEGGVYGQSMPWQSTLDGYFQAGAVDFNDPDWFVDGQAAVTRPLWRNLSAGLGVWGAAQPGLSRFDVGPRASLRLGRGMRAHLDYRLNVAGNARPGSGTVVTLAGDF